MKSFNRFFDAFEKVSASVPADRCFIAVIELQEEKHRLVFVEAGSTGSAVRFISWFRWVFLALAIGFSVFVYRSLGSASQGIIVVIAWIFIVFSGVLGIVGTFVIAPVLCRIFMRLQAQGEKNSAKLPFIDLSRRTLHPPDSGPGLPFDQVLGLKSIKGADDWNKLIVLTQDGTTVFLLNYPVSRAKRISKMLKRLSGLTSIKLLDEPKG